MRISLGLAALLTGTLTAHAYGSCRHGVEHQLEGLGIQHTFSLLPWEQAECDLPEPTLADAVFVLPAPISAEPMP